MLLKPKVHLFYCLKAVGNQGHVGQSYLVLLGRVGVFGDLKDGDVMMIFSESKEDPKILLFVGDLHPEDIAIEPFRCIQVPYLEDYMSYTLDRHWLPPLIPWPLLSGVRSTVD